jgi:hypothetical protein
MAHKWVFEVADSILEPCATDAPLWDWLGITFLTE